MPVTLWLTLLSLILIIVLSLPLGILSAKRRGGVIDKAINFISQISFSIPPFFLGLILILVFGIILRLFIPGAYVSYSDNFGGFIVYLIFPALAIALPKTATVIKFLRASLLEQLKSDYVRTARSKGSSDNRLLYRHVLRNAIIPVTALLGMIIADILAGSIIIEQVFGLPGMGRLLISAISSRDFPLAQSMVVLIAFVVVFVNFLVDISIQLIDRRIKVN
jgi:ABC-type dipeptide/oligopeptide/nickel transport system permease component